MVKYFEICRKGYETHQINLLGQDYFVNGPKIALMY